jgi:hypothetical protein
MVVAKVSGPLALLRRWVLWRLRAAPPLAAASVQQPVNCHLDEVQQGCGGVQ